MTQTKRVRRFGPLFYSSLTIAVLLVIAVFGWQSWQIVDRRITTHRYLMKLRDPHPDVRQLTVERLRAIGADYSPILIELLNHEDAGIRHFACEQLGALRPLDDSALSPLILSLSDADPMVRCYAAYAIAAYATTARQLSDQEQESAIRHLCDGLQDENADARVASAYALGEFGGRSPVIIPALTAALADKEPNVRLQAAWSLYAIDHDYLSLMVPIIEEVMSGDDTSAHDFVFGIVHALGPVAEDVMPDVVKGINRRFGR